MRVFFSLLAFFFLLGSVLAELRICSSCGHEISDGSINCTNCGAKAPEKKSKEIKVVKQDSSAEVDSVAGLIDPEIVEDNVRVAVQKLQEGAVDTGNLLLKNAAVLNSLLPLGEARDTINQVISTYMVAGRGSGTATFVQCPTCGGTGKRMMKIDSLATGKVEMQEAYGMHCPTCRGSGMVAKASTINEQKFNLARALREYMDMQKMRGYEQVGGAFLPPGVAVKLKPSEVAGVRKLTAAPCKECGGFGRQDCKACNGCGLVKCTAEGCLEGRVTIVVRGTLARGDLTRSSPCKQCRGTGKRACAKCGGQGSTICSECNGTGEREGCRKCGGQGYSQCRSCGGVGSTEKGMCTACGGTGEIICSTCKGDGKQ